MPLNNNKIEKQTGWRSLIVVVKASRSFIKYANI